MDVSILQHSRDSSPQQVAVAEVVELIRGSQWPPGYQPLLIAASVVMGGRLRKHVRWLTELGVVKLTGKKEEVKSKRELVQDDPHTVLCWTDGSGGCYVVYKYELNDGYGKEQQIRYYGRVQQFCMEYYARLTDCEADHTLVGVTKPVPLCHDPDVWYRDPVETMPFLATDIGGKRSDKTKSDNGKAKATNEDIKRYLADHIHLRRNMVTSRVEYRDFDTPDWRPIDDVRQNSLWDDMSETFDVDYRAMDRIINSQYAGAYYPFHDYLRSLPKWDGETDAIRVLSLTVTVKGGEEKQELFYRYLKKWLVGMVAGWIDDEEVNQAILVLLGRQGIYKTTWFSNLLPPELRRYFYTKTNSGTISKDDKLVLAQFGLICCEELDTMKPSEMNQLKSLVTARYLDDRAAYARYSEHRKHIASFCGTGNNVQFLNDTSGTRRWLPFEVESILPPRDFPFDYEGIYSQAYGLWCRGYPYYFSEVETEHLMKHNEAYETPNSECELIEEFFRKPVGKEPCEFIRTAVAAEVVSTPGMRVSAVDMGRAFSKLGYQGDKKGGSRGFYVVRLSSDERRARARLLAQDGYQPPPDDGQMDR